MNREMRLLAAAEITHAEVPMEVFNMYAPALYKYAFRLYPNVRVADQAVGDVFARFLERSSMGGHPRINLRLELYALAYEILARDIRYSNSFVKIETNFLKNTALTDLDIEDRQLFQKLHYGLMHSLTDDQRHVVMLRFMEGFSVKETALITGKKVGTVKVIQNRGLAALRKALDSGAMETRTIALFIRRLSYA